jgi:Protein of unknown function (DUF3014)
MGRYDRNTKKNAKPTVLIMPFLMALLFGISGTFVAFNIYKKAKHAEDPVFFGGKATETSQPATQPDKPIGMAETKPITLPPAPVPIVTIKQQQTPLQPIALPDLLSSDGPFRQSVLKVSPGLGQWLVADQLIRRYMMIFNDFAQGIRVSKHLSFIRLEEPFAALQNDNTLYLAPKGYRRYDVLAKTLSLADAKAAVAVYRQFRPLMLQEFSYPKDITLESVVSKALGEILAAPVIEGPLELVRPSLFYKFADPRLEVLNPVQKQMIRMGPENMRLIQQKCREFLVELGK